MHGFKGERTLMRIYVGERDKFHGKPLYEAIVMMLRNRHYAGVTVLRAIMGFGASSHLRSDRIEVLSTDLPIVIECVETADRIQAVLPELDTMIGGGLITLERAKVIMYRPHDQAEEGADDWSLDVHGA
jgi:PII-like signaling protein